MSKRQASKVSKSKSRQVRLVRATKSPGDGANPFREGSGYGDLFAIGSRKAHTKAELIKLVAEKTHKSQKCVSYDLAVLMSPGHSSNGNRSAAEPLHPTKDEKFILVDKRVMVGGAKPAPKTSKKTSAKKTTGKKSSVKKPATKPAPKAPAPASATVVATTSPAPVTTDAPASTESQTPAEVAQTPEAAK